MQTFDFVIVGAGTAGCVLAYRLSARGYRVCVVEAGPVDRNPYIRIPGGIMKTSTDPSITWQFNHQGSANTNGRSIPFIQGRTLGGSSAINGMIYSRGQPADFNGWAAAGAQGWDYESVLPYFRKSERFMGEGEARYRGREGNMPITVLAKRSAVCDSFIRGAVEQGIPYNPDYNGCEQTGVGYTQANIYKGKRWSAAYCFLRPARRQFGVTVITDALVRRIVVADNRATGIEYSRSGETTLHTVRSNICTIISAGSVNSPKLLQLSGIGPARLLQDLGITVVRDLPGVGENLSDHYAARIVVRTPGNVETVNQHSRGIPLIREVTSWMLGRPSILAMSSMSVYAFCKSNETSTENDYAVTFTPASLKAGKTRKLDDFPGVTSGAWRLRPESRGYIRIESRDANHPPIVQPNYLDAESDRRILITALRRSHAILHSDAMKHIFREQVFPTADCQTDEQWLAFIREYGTTAFHLVGTCKMGALSDPMSVVDPTLKIKGIDGLRVVDASVMPTTPSANTNASTLMIAEKAADMILQELGRTS
ncbi:GMC family oxidoreductase [Advenella mimigardefordensis]|uniref:Putative glucose-methanol-choline oxidoreductase n=1 Tax=Advenella mimigardefordensis (strain DSM 17166 / LMG 22922 / DPN7) TaxID=1247726 RepID=W0PBS2_ADVMD|nr:FAD-dependent oxidoreductase [Advenella mimigardefordensis]AHG64176.1 putative glucose-methanol-choline oxidoreductase [Advenella mimigardefordensis DPN7]